MIKNKKLIAALVLMMFLFTSIVPSAALADTTTPSAITVQGSSDSSAALFSGTGSSTSSSAVTTENNNANSSSSNSSGTKLLSLRSAVATPSAYDVKIVTDITGGAVTASPNNNVAEGTTVTVTATPDSGYELADVTVTTTTGSAVVLTEAGNVRTFEMPGCDVNIDAEFTEIVAATLATPEYETNITLPESGMYTYNEEVKVTFKQTADAEKGLIAGGKIYYTIGTKAWPNAPKVDENVMEYNPETGIVVKNPNAESGESGSVILRVRAMDPDGIHTASGYMVMMIPFDKKDQNTSAVPATEGTYYSTIEVSSNLSDWGTNFGSISLIKNGKITSIYSSSLNFICNNVEFVVSGDAGTLKVPVKENAIKSAYLAGAAEDNLINEDGYTLDFGSQYTVSGQKASYDYVEIPVTDINNIYVVNMVNSSDREFTLYFRISDVGNTEPAFPKDILDGENFELVNKLHQKDGKYYQPNLTNWAISQLILTENTNYGPNVAYYIVFDDNDSIDTITEENSSPIFSNQSTQKIALFQSRNTAYPGTDNAQKRYITIDSEKDMKLEIRVKAVIKGNGWTKETEESTLYTLNFWKAGIQQNLFEGNGIDLLFSNSETGYMVPVGSTFKGEPITDSEKLEEIAEKLKVNVASLYAYDVGLFDEEGNAASPVSYTSGNSGWIIDGGSTSNSNKLYLQDSGQEGFDISYQKIYYIDSEGKVAERKNTMGVFAGQMGYSWTLISHDDTLNGTYVYVQDEATNTELKEGKYEVTADFVDSNYKPMAESNYIDGKVKLVVDTAGNRTAYIPLKADVNGNYITEFKIANGESYTAVEIKDQYTVDGKIYPKVIVISASSERAVTAGKLTVNGEEKEMYYSLNLWAASTADFEVKTTTPVLDTEGQVYLFASDATASVDVTSYATNADVYYTTGSGAFDINTWTKLEGNTIELKSADATIRNSYTVRVAANSEKYGLSGIASLKITFAAEGEAVEAVKTPVIDCVDQVHMYGSTYWSAEQYFEYMKAIPLTLSTATEGADIYYTTDGSEPTLNNPNAKLYTAGSTINAKFFGEYDSSYNFVDNGAANGTIKAAAYKDGYLASEVAERTFTRDFDWWERLDNGEYEVNLRMLHFTMENTLSMGHLTLAGTGKVVVDGNDRWLDIQFQPMDLGGIPAYLRNMWYFDNAEDGQGNDFKDKWTEATYKLGLQEGTEVEWARIKLYSKDELQAVAIQSNFEPMGIQRAWMEIDYSELSGTEKTKEVDMPEIATVFAADESYIEARLSMPSASAYADAAKIYYVVSTGEVWDAEKAVEYKTGDVIKITPDMADPSNKSLNILFKAVVEGDPAMESMLVVQKLTFSTVTDSNEEEKEEEKDKNNQSKPSEDADVTKDGKYRVQIALYKADRSEPSMGDVAFDKNREAIITTEDGVSTIQIASNPVRIDPYYSALKEIQFMNAKGQWQYVTEVDRITITANDGSEEHDLDYLSVFKFVLPDTESEFVDVKISVPYTPMDGIAANVGGFINACLKIEWDTLEKTDSDDELKANTSAAKGKTEITSEEVDITDKATGIRLNAGEDVLPEDTTMKVEAITEGTNYDTAAAALEGISDTFKLYNIVVKADGEDAEPSRTVAIYFPIPSDYDAAKVAVYRINEDGTKVVVKGELKNGNYVIETKTFGMYALVLTDEVLNQEKYAKAIQKVVDQYPDLQGHWAASTMAAMVNRGLLSGVSDNQMAPDTALTRGMMVTILHRMAGSPAPDNGGYFRDVPDFSWYAEPIRWASNNGVVNGVGEKLFAPDQAITREQLAVMLVNYAAVMDIELPRALGLGFSDADAVSDWADEAVRIMVSAKIIGGYEDGTLRPDATATRAEAAAMVERFLTLYVDPMTEAEETEV